MNRLEKIRMMDEGKDFDQIFGRLSKLYEDGRITSGAAFIVYNPYEIHSYTWRSELWNKACDCKNYTQYLKNRISAWDAKYYVDKFEQDWNNIIAFIEEQENLPFEQTQKQLLIANKELTQKD